uniref:RxLR effector candidate protein n=1 Tax=Hyaloperonospora arabidopsidis (strain Emoy2) TaxID=559515 RepID=M4BPM9_HYAAE|nr:RxLR effector candidate protein [Hyaloperonospora arabidopsidis Emoy2]
MMSGCGGEDKLAYLLGTVRKNFPASAKVSELETLLLTNWRIDNLTPRAAAGRLKMKRSVEGLTSPSLGILMKYIAMFKDANADCKFSLLKTFIQRFGEEAVAGVLLRDSLVNDWTADVKILVTELLKSWLADGKSVRNVFESLKLGESKPLKSFDRRLEALESFTKLFNELNSANVELLPALVSYCDGEDILAHILGQAVTYKGRNEKVIELETLLFTEWKGKKLMPKAIVHRLELMKNVEN